MFQEMASASFIPLLSLAITGNLSQSLVHRSLICSEIYNNFDFYEDQLKLSHHTSISRHEYLNKMVRGNQCSTNTEISITTRILQSNINIWLQGRDGQNNIYLTKWLRKNLWILLSVEMWICFYTRIISNCLYKILLNQTVISFIRQ
jgi:hypothetical protein